MKGRVIKGLGSIFTVYYNGAYYKCSARGKIKQDTKILIGDYVEFKKHSHDEYVIERVLDRKNKLIRPEIANIDGIFMMISKSPKPDLVMVDKMLLYSQLNNIEFTLIVNKLDILDHEFIEKIKNEYEGVTNVIFVSAKEKTNIDKLFDLIEGKFITLSGQSAVGKSALLNSLDSSLNIKEGELSKKVSRGKHTTRHTQFYNIKDNIFIADTPGFSLLDVELDHNRLSELYPDFEEYVSNCKIRTCNHVEERQCGVKQAVESEKINVQRYERYKKIYAELKKKWETKYD